MVIPTTRSFATRQELSSLWLDLFGRPYPEKIICVGLNYRSHSAEQDVEPPARPLLFAKWPNALIGSAEPIRLSRITSQVDFEAELGVVIGEGGAIWGYTCVNDVSARDQEAITLTPRDLRATGTPAGVGAFRVPPVFLADGDEISVELEGVGRLTNRVSRT